MTLAAQLARLLCEEIEPVPGVVHDPSQPLVLGNKDANDYVVVTWDQVNHRVQIQSVYQPPGGSVQQSVMTFSYNGSFLINGQSVADLAEFQALLLAAQEAAAAAAAAASSASTSAEQANSAADGAQDQASTASDAASLALAYAQAPSGTPLPGGGNSSAVSAALAQEIATESRDLDIGDLVTGNETFQAGFLFTERPVTPATPGATVQITIPPNIYQSNEKKARWGAYRLRAATGGVKFIAASGGTNLIAPRRVNYGRELYRVASAGAALRHTLAVTVSWGVPVVDGEIVLIFHALHQGTAQSPTLNFASVPSKAWVNPVAYPAAPSGVAYPDYAVYRVPFMAVAAGSLVANFDEGGGYTHLQACDWFVLDGVEGTAPIIVADGRISAGVVKRQVILPAVAAQSYMFAVAQMGQPVASGQWSAFSSQLTRIQSGGSAGAPDAATPDDNTMKNEAWAAGDGVATVAGDQTLTCNFSAASGRGNMIGFAYKPKTVIGGGTVVMNLEGGRDTLTVPNGVAEVWFQNDGMTVDIRTPKP